MLVAIGYDRLAESAVWPSVTLPILLVDRRVDRSKNIIHYSPLTQVVDHSCIIMLKKYFCHLSIIPLVSIYNKFI
jgi:hypothetical protein